MKKVKLTIYWPWAGVGESVQYIDVEDDCDEGIIENIAYETFNDMIWDKISTNWEVVEEDEE